MKTKGYLIVNNKGQMRITKGIPGLDYNEVAVQLQVELPDALFRKPRLEASITVPDSAAVSDVIKASMTDNVQDALKQATGLDFAIRVVPADEKDS